MATRCAPLYSSLRLHKIWSDCPDNQTPALTWGPHGFGLALETSRTVDGGQSDEGMWQLRMKNQSHLLLLPVRMKSVSSLEGLGEC